MRKKVLVFIFIILMLAGCSSAAKEKAEIYKMEDFSTVEHGSSTIEMDSSAFKKAWKHAKRNRGIVDVMVPDYKVEIGEDSYFLWLDKEYGSMMDAKDTNTLYTLSEPYVTELNSLLK